MARQRVVAGDDEGIVRSPAGGGRTKSRRARVGVPLVSVVIPCYGQAHFLAESIESVLAQTHPNIEIVVVDDGSPDDTAEIAGRYPNVKLVRQPHGGLSSARNAGLLAATGDFVIFLDADDRLLPDAAEAGLAAFQGAPEAAFVAGRHVRIDVAGHPLEHPQAPAIGGDPYYALLHGNQFGMHAAVMYRRTAIERIGGFDPSLPACEDYDVYLRLTRQSPTCQHDVVVAEYRRHPGNMSADPVRMLREVLGVLHRQLPHVTADPELFDGYVRGVRNWTEYYLDELTRWAAPATTDIPPPPATTAEDHSVPEPDAPATPAVGAVQMGDLRRLAPISTEFGFDRGRPIDRHYIEAFLAAHAGDIRGRVLEIGDDTYTRRYGGDAVTQADVLHITAGNPHATFVGALESCPDLPSGAFDCVVLTQTLQLIFDLPAALATVNRILKAGGVLLATVPGISQIARDQWEATWSWAFTPYALRRLFDEAFQGATVQVRAHGNVLTSIAFLHGLADSELAAGELDHHDPAYPMLVTGRVVTAAPPR